MKPRLGAALIAASPLVRPLAWATGAVSVYAIWDYGRAVRRGDGGSRRNVPTRRRKWPATRQA